ncbi:MAG: ATP-binding protein [Actinomycetota bacterium]
MPLNLPPLALDADPASVKKARDWVRRLLVELRREDLVDPAELGVSELVTNAILHGTPPITIRVRGTRRHPRVEIRDASNHPPSVNVEMADEEYLLATFGRGLGLVALNSSAWGADLDADGKVVWFEPASDPRVEGDLDGAVFDLDQTVTERIESAGPSGDSVRVQLRDVPVALYSKFRRRYYELARELRLLSLVHGDAYPIATELAEVFLEAERLHRLTRGWDRFNQLLAGDADRGDVELVVPAEAPPLLLRLLESLERADEFCRQERLLVLSATPAEAELQRWFFHEFSRQAAGEPPLPWPGPFTVDEAPAAS